MKFISVKSFEDPVRDASLVFLAQRLQELTFDYSLDSYKAPTMNVPALIDEARSQIAFGAAHGERELGSASHIVDELCARLRGNPISNALVRHERNASKILRSKDVSAISALLDSLHFELSQRAYAMKAMKILEDDIAVGHKSEIDYLAREIVCSLINMGMSRKFLNESIINYFLRQRGT